MGDRIDRDAASQIIARISAGRLRVKDAMQEMSALPAAPAEDVRAGTLLEAANHTTCRSFVESIAGMNGAAR